MDINWKSEQKELIDIAVLWNDIFNTFFIPKFHLGVCLEEKEVWESFLTDCFPVPRKNIYPQLFEDLRYTSKVKNGKCIFTIEQCLEISVLKENRGFYLELSLLNNPSGELWGFISKKICNSSFLNEAEQYSFQEFMVGRHSPQWFREDLIQDIALESIRRGSSADSYEHAPKGVY